MNPDFLYNLLPAIYRERDASLGQPLRAFLAVLQSQAERIENSIDQLYDDWFIETCQEWLIPYIGDLLQLGDALELPDAVDPRNVVANMLAYRHRRGTPIAAEQLLQNWTGWPIRLAEGSYTTATTANVRYRRAPWELSLEVRGAGVLENLGGPFDKAAYLGDVRSPNPAGRGGRGRHGISTVTLFAWPVDSYPVEQARPRPLAPGLFTFDALGLDRPLYKPPLPKPALDTRTGPEHVPGPLTRSQLAALLTSPAPQLPFAIAARAVAGNVLTADLRMADLSVWPIPGRSIFPATLPGSVTVLVDPELGRLAVDPSVADGVDLAVDYWYGFSADLGGGPYSRINPADALADVEFRVQIPSTRMALDDQGNPQRDDEGKPVHENLRTIGDALAFRDRRIAAGGAGGGAMTIEILDNATYDVPPTGIRGTGTITIQAADGYHPSILGDLAVKGEGASLLLTLEGLRIGGSVVLEGHVLLILADTTIWPTGTCERPALTAVPAGSGDDNSFSITAESCILGPVELSAPFAEITLGNCIVDGRGGDAVNGQSWPGPQGSTRDPWGNEIWGPRLAAERCTFLGPIRVMEMHATSECVFAGAVSVRDTSLGSVRYSYVPTGSQTPPRYQCQPDMALSGVKGEGERDQVKQRVRPAFLPGQYPAPKYGRLSASCPAEILQGAEDHREVGVFHDSAWGFKEELMLRMARKWLATRLEPGMVAVG